jgi:uncharacterized membrane protein
MDLRLAVHDIAEQNHLSPDARARLFALAELDKEAPQLTHKLPFGVAILAAVLVGLGIIFWVAANWESLGRAGRFALLQAVVLVMCLGAIWRPRARLPLSLLVLLATGALFAYFGQTYQTGADPWQLFALWAVLTLPLCLSVRHDALWAAWALVAMSSITLWVHANTGRTWRIDPQDFSVHLIGWGMATVLVLALSPLLHRQTGAGPWAARVSLTLAVVMIGLTALGDLFSQTVGPAYWLGLAVLGSAAATLLAPRLFEPYLLSAVALGINTLLVAGLGRLLLEDGVRDPILSLLIIGLIAAGLLGATVSLIIKRSRLEHSEVAQ